jgi:hypothetical protein
MAPATGTAVIFDGWPPKEWFAFPELEGTWKAVVKPDADPIALDWAWCAGFAVLVVSTGARAVPIAKAVAIAKPRVIDLLLVAVDGYELVPYGERA